MNIAIDTRSLLSSCRTGVGEYTYNFVDNLIKRKEHNFFLFYNSYNDSIDLSEFSKRNNVQVVKKNIPNKLFNLSQKLVGFPKIDKIIENEVKTDLDLFLSPNLNFTSLSGQTKHVLTIHDLSFVYFSECYSKKQKLWHRAVNPVRQCKEAVLILTPSTNTKRDLIEEYNLKKEKVKVIYPGVSGGLENKERLKKEVKEEYGLSEEFVLFLGTLEPRKNTFSLLEAFTQLDEKLKQKYKLVIAGAKGWKYDSVLNKIEDKDNINYIGYVKQKHKKALYELASLFVYPSFYEGFGFPVLEAMSQKTPVITSNRSSLPEITNGSAYLIDSYDTENLTLGIKRLVQQEKLRKLYTEKGVEQTKKFSWKQAAGRFFELIK